MLQLERKSVCHPDLKHYGRGLCKPCWADQYYAQPHIRAKNAAKQRRYRIEKSPEERKQDDFKSRLREHYGLSVDEFFKMVSDQDGKCALCDKIPVRLLTVDHNHTTGKIRKLLCFGCNTRLGYVEMLCPCCLPKINYGREDEWMQRARIYLAANN